MHEIVEQFLKGVHTALSLPWKPETWRRVFYHIFAFLAVRLSDVRIAV